MPRIKHTVEQIITKLREAEVALSKGSPLLKFAAPWGLPNKPTIAGGTSTGTEDRSGETAQGVGA
jgi:hypothetical protein